VSYLSKGFIETLCRN